MTEWAYNYVGTLIKMKLWLIWLKWELKEKQKQKHKILVAICINGCDITTTFLLKFSISLDIFPPLWYFSSSGSLHWEQCLDFFFYNLVILSVFKIQLKCHLLLK